MQYRSKGIILKNFKLNESDRIIKILTEERGLVSAVAKGARKSTSSLAAKTQTLNECDFLLAKGKSLDIVSEVSIVQKFTDLNTDLLSMYLAFFCSELTVKISLDDSCSVNYFYLLEIYLEFLKKLSRQSSLAEDITENQKLLLTVEFLWCLICELGYKPDLENCSRTNARRKPNQIPQYFDLANGSICSKAAFDDYMDSMNSAEQIIPLSKFNFKLLESLDKSPLSNLNSDFYVADIMNSYSVTQNESQELDDLKYRKILIEDFLLSYLKLSVEEYSNSDYDLSLQNQELASTIKLLYKHLEFQIQEECKSWKALAEIML